MPQPELEPSIIIHVCGDLNGKCFPQAAVLEHMSLIRGTVGGRLGGEGLLQGVCHGVGFEMKALSHS